MSPTAKVFDPEEVSSTIINIMRSPTGYKYQITDLISVLATISPEQLSRIPEIVLDKPTLHDRSVLTALAMQYPQLRICTPYLAALENIDKVMEEISFRGLRKEGIFRLTFDLEGAARMTREVVAGESIDVINSDPYDLAIVIKGFTKLAFPNFLKISDLELFQTNGIITEYLETQNTHRREYLSKLSALCRKVAEQEDKNKMNLHNLARVFAPNMFQDLDPMVEMRWINTTIAMVERIFREA